MFNTSLCRHRNVYFNDHLKISAFASRHQHRHQNRHQHQHCKKIIFTFRNFFERIEYLCFFCSELWHQYTLLQILISLRFPIHPYKGVYWCSRKRLFEFSETSVHWCFQKITAPKNSAYFPSKKSTAESFLITLVGLPGTFPKSSLEQLFCRETVSVCFCKKGNPQRVLSQEFSRILKTCLQELFGSLGYILCFSIYISLYHNS